MTAEFFHDGERGLSEHRMAMEAKVCKPKNGEPCAFSISELSGGIEALLSRLSLQEQGESQKVA